MEKSRPVAKEALPKWSDEWPASLEDKRVELLKAAGFKHDTSLVQLEERKAISIEAARDLDLEDLRDFATTKAVEPNEAEFRFLSAPSAHRQILMRR